MRNSNLKFSTSRDVRAVVQSLRALHVPTPAFDDLCTHFGDLLAQRRADEADGVAYNARGLILVGDSGSGKTTALRELVRKYSSVMQTDPAQNLCEYIDLKVPSPATMKVVGTETLRALGYQLTSDKRQGPAIWDQVKVELKLRSTKFLGFDEAQDLARYETVKERQAVVNTLKSLMENSVFPVGLVLAGTSGLKKIVNQDVQLARRMRPVEISRLHAVRDVGHVIRIVGRYADRAGIEAGASLKSEAFAMRLMHAADYQFGLLTEITVEAASKALFSDGFDAQLDVAHFVQVYHQRNGVSEWLNPFVAEDYARIDPRRLFDDASQEDDE